MSQLSERTRLLRKDSNPQYIFNSGIIGERKRNVRRLQYCLFSLFLSAFILGFVVAISFTINPVIDTITDNNTTNTTTNLPSIETFIFLINNSLPLPETVLETEIYDDNKNNIEFEHAMEAGRRALEERENIEKNTPSLQIDTPSYRHSKVLATTTKSIQLSKIGYMEEFATKFILRNSVRKNKRICFQSKLNYCKNSVEHIKCNSKEKYRTYNGTCNNLNNPMYGASYIPFRRSLPPNYADGISKPRVARDGKSLPKSRTVSLVVHRPFYRNDTKFTVMLAVWGQFLDHDITATATSRGTNGSSISCCGVSNPHPECFPVELDPTDPLIEYNQTCFEFVRSANAPTCCLGPRQQLNQASAFIDGSVIYGHDDEIVGKLRLYQSGLLDMFLTEDNRTLLPFSKDTNDGCNREDQNKKGRYCFLSGDARANENLQLTSMHLIWARQHNFLVQHLVKLNPHWNDERLFQEARRIVGAQMQYITYKEFLPILFGKNLMENINIYPKTHGYSNSYDENIDPSIANCFAASAFRFAHTLIPGLMKFLANNTDSPDYIQTHKMLFDPYRLYQSGQFDNTLRGAMNTVIEASDPYFTNELKMHLFESFIKKPIKPCGLDLVSLNIQRGRDHGLPGYTSWHEHCGFKKPESFQDLWGVIDDSSLENIKNIYRHVDDIDLYTGALSEKPLNGSILGPTITCLLLDQFIRLKVGDRFWHENFIDKSISFTLSQLNEIRKTTLSKIICDNSDNVKYVQTYVMETIRSDNKLIECDKLPSMNLYMWKENNQFKHVQLFNNELYVKIHE